MICSETWSFDRYVPLNRTDRIYIKQVVPQKKSITLCWSGGDEDWTVYFRRLKGEEAWQQYRVSIPHIVLTELEEHVDYEFYVESKGEKSWIGYARTGDVPGTVVNYLHPKDPKYAFSGQHLCTPSILIHPDGYLLASMDVFEGGEPQNLTLIFRSDDGGKSWYHYTELFPCFWGTLFLHRGDVYMLATSTEYGDLLIGRSLDGGKNWGTPTVLSRGSCHRVQGGWHKSSMPVIEHEGRLWCGVDWGSHRSGGHMTCLLSADASGDLLKASNWCITEPLRYDPNWPGAVKWDSRGFIEGNAVVAPSGEICNMLRYMTDQGMPQYGLAGLLRGNVKDPNAALSFYKFVPFPGNLSKFDVKRDENSGIYFSILSRVVEGGWVSMRSVLSLACSTDLEQWHVLCDLINCEDMDARRVGFQYVSFAFDGDDLVYLSRTAYNEAQSFHDNNYITFDRIQNFRSLIPKTL